MDRLTRDVIDYLTGERVAMRPVDIAVGITSLASRVSAWSSAPIDAWLRTIDKAVADGLLVKQGDKVFLAPDEEPTKKSIQLGLFE